MGSTRPTYIYGLADPRSPWDVRYVGASVAPQRRLRQHLREALSDHKSHKLDWIRDLVAEGVRPMLKVIDVHSDVEVAREQERFLVKWYRADGHRLTNATADGQGLVGGRGNGWWTKERRQAQSERMRGSVPPGLAAAHENDPSLRVRAARAGGFARKGVPWTTTDRKQSPEHVAKRAAAMRGKSRKEVA